MPSEVHEGIFRQLFMAESQECLIALSTDGNMLGFNHAAINLGRFLCGRDLVTGHSFSAWVPVQNRGNYTNALTKAAQGERYDGTNILHVPFDESVIIRTLLVPMLDSSGQVVAILFRAKRGGGGAAIDRRSLFNALPIHGALEVYGITA